MGGTGNLGRIQQLVEGLGAWLDGGADPTEPEAWTGLMARATWSPAMELKGHVLYVDFMEHMKRRKKHVSTEMFELGSHHASQVRPSHRCCPAAQHACDVHCLAAAAHGTFSPWAASVAAVGVQVNQNTGVAAQPRARAASRRA